MDRRDARRRDERRAGRTLKQWWYRDPFVRWDERAFSFLRDVSMTEMVERKTGQAAAGDALPPVYRPGDVEPGIYERWAAADVFAPDGEGSRARAGKPPFVIIQPPPNVTGALHLGHAQRASVEDALIRHARMTGRPALWLPGVDHASIAAHYVLDAIIATEGESRASLGRERYLERMWRFMDETRGTIAAQHLRLGASADWKRLRFTMDAGSAQAVRTSFKRLWDDGLAYRAEALINWCPGCRTSLSDLEVISRPERGTLWSVRYHLAREDGAPDPDAWITLATTRPETIVGDTAVAVHPDDERYRDLVGRNVVVPFVERVVPVIADEAVERSFGTGALKITPAHDHADHETARRHGLPVVDVMGDDGTMNDAAGPYTGLDRFEARKRILADLETRGDLAGSVAHEMVVGHCQRSDDVVEPRLKTQWFVRTRPLAEKAMAAVREGRTRILPPRFERVFFHWMENIRDWNVSRQLWWGHRIPAWYCPDGHITVSDLELGPDACAACGRPAAELRQDDDIFDTWYSSGLWPFSTLGWPEETDDYRRYYPTTVMETAYDILFFWVARMMMLGEWLTGREPFQIVYLGGLVLDPQGKRMSKTKGNVIDPLGVIDELGADALRFSLIDGIAPGANIQLGRPKLEGARNFANKLWNASRYVLGSRPAELPADAPLGLPSPDRFGPAESWILGRLADATARVSRAYEELLLGEAARILHESIWGDYCDWYLELAKAQLGSADTSPEERIAIWQVLTWTLDRYLRLLHPIMPFVTEAIWQALPHHEDDPDLLIVAPWPDPADAQDRLGSGDAPTAAAVDSLLALIRAIRNARAEAGIEASAWLEAELRLADAPSREAYERLLGPFAKLARIRPVVVADGAGTAEQSAGKGWISVVGDRHEARLARPEADIERESERLRGELGDAERLLGAAQRRLADGAFVTRAPPAVVEGARAREMELRERVDRLRGRLAELAG